MSGKYLLRKNNAEEFLMILLERETEILKALDSRKRRSDICGYCLQIQTTTIAHP